MAEELTRERRLEILESLGSTECAGCKGPKPRKRSHCRTCYYAPPQYMRQALYRGFGSGYEEAFEESLRYLAAMKVQQ
jgi:hypothetical protein